MAVPSGLDRNDIAGSLVWTSSIADFNPIVHRLSEDWVRDQVRAPVAVHHVIDEELHDPAGKPFAHRSLSVVTRRSIVDVPRTSPRQSERVVDAAQELKITASLPGIPVDPQEPESGPDDDADEAEGFPEGRIQYRVHRTYERSRRLRELAKRRALKTHGRIACVVCGFDFAAVYGALGDGFIECHHTKSVSTLPEGATTKLEDIALLCANCHRMVHRRRPWLTRDELPNLLLRPQRLPRS